MLENLNWQSDSLRKAFVEITQARVAALQCSAYVADETSEIDTTLENTRGGVASIETNLATAQLDLDELTDEWRTLVVYVDHVLADSVWSSVATHEVINVPDGVEIEFELTIQDSIALQGADSLIVEIGANKIMALLKNDWDAGEYAQVGLTEANFIAGAYNVYNPAIAGCGVNGKSTGSVTLYGTTKGIDIGYEVQTATIVNAGYSIWTFKYRISNGSGAVAAGAGGSL